MALYSSNPLRGPGSASRPAVIGVLQRGVNREIRGFQGEKIKSPICIILPKR